MAKRPSMDRTLLVNYSIIHTVVRIKHSKEKTVRLCHRIEVFFETKKVEVRSRGTLNETSNEILVQSV